MFPARLLKITASLLVSALTALTTAGHVFHEVSCSGSCHADERVQPEKPGNHACCSHSHPATSGPTAEIDADRSTEPEGPPGHHDEDCAICVYLALSSLSPFPVAEPPAMETVEWSSVRSERVIDESPAELWSARGPPRV